MDRAGRRPILLSGAVAMAIALTATGWWIYIDQAITPNAGERGCRNHGTKLMGSCGMCDHLQCRVWDELGTGAMVVSSGDYAPAVPSEGRVTVDRYELAFRECCPLCYHLTT